MRYFFLGLFCWLLSTSVMASGKVYILCYHTFLGKPQFATDFSISEFKDQIHALKQANFKFVQWQDVLGDRIHGDHNVLVVIDDGNISTWTAYQDVLKPLGIKPMLAIYPGITGTRKFALSWDQLRMMLHEGCEVACHGYFHMYFTQKYHDAHPQDFDNEFYLSKKILQDKLGISINEMVYPFGVSSDIARSTLKSAGYHYGFSLRQAPLVVPVPATEVWDLPRYMVTRGARKSIFNVLLHAQKG